MKQTLSGLQTCQHSWFWEHGTHRNILVTDVGSTIVPWINKNLINVWWSPDCCFIKKKNDIFYMGSWYIFTCSFFSLISWRSSLVYSSRDRARAKGWKDKGIWGCRMLFLRKHVWILSFQTLCSGHNQSGLYFGCDLLLARHACDTKESTKRSIPGCGT